jgi:hypothetical protein
MYHSIIFQVLTLKPYLDLLSQAVVCSAVEVFKTQSTHLDAKHSHCCILGWLTKFSQLSFTNVVNRGHFRWVYDGFYHDEDGSLANVPGSIILPLMVSGLVQVYAK